MDVLLYWAQALVRWGHVLSVILWIGQTYLFNFFEKNLERSPETAANPKSSGSLWMVHGGGFYQLEKWKEPEIRPQTLHWFKWEAAASWLTGTLLLWLTYYQGGLLVEPGMSYWRATTWGVGAIALGWVIYDAVCRSPLGTNDWVFALLTLISLPGLCYILMQVMSERSAYIHVGAMVGTIMAANVWMRILPSQRRLIALAEAGRETDWRLAAIGPQRSKHNSYMAIPLIFLMISNHYPTISYGHSFGWAVLGMMILVGWGAARFLRGQGQHREKP